MKKFEPTAIEEPPKSKLSQEEERLVYLKNERLRLEKEIDILRIRYDDRQRMFQEQERQFQQKVRVDQDLITKQLVDNKSKSDKLDKTQSEVNQMRAKVEESAKKQREILLRKEVELDKALDGIKKERAELAKNL